MEELLITRQAIFNAKLQVSGYALRFSATPNLAQLSLEHIEKFIGGHLGFIDCTEIFRQEDFIAEHLKHKIILQLSAYSLQDQESQQKAKDLKQDGYQLALYGFDDLTHFEPWIDTFSFIKFDALNLNEETLMLQKARLSGKNVKTILERVENHELLKLASKLAFDLLQGNFLSQPNLQAKSKSSFSASAVVQLLQKLQDPDIGPSDLEEVISQDPRLAYKLLQIINSPAYGVRRKIDSLREAIIYMGLQPMRRWASLIAMSNVEDKPHELVLSAMIRAKMCETLANYYNYDDASRFFTTGLLSTLDALMDMEMKELLETLSLSEQITEALLDRKGEIGTVLSRVIFYERGEWEEAQLPPEEHKIYAQSYITSVEWAENYCSPLK